jgi:hypothetical protein
MAEYNSCADLIQDKDKVTEIENAFIESDDPLQDMLNMQNWLQTILAKKLPEDNISPDQVKTKGQMVDWMDRNYDAIMDEFRELKNAIGGMSKGEKEASAVWKKWKANHQDISNELISEMPDEDRLEMLFEMIDIWHFMMNKFLALGLTSKDIYILYMLKNAENKRRYDSGY